MISSRIRAFTALVALFSLTAMVSGDAWARMCGVDMAPYGSVGEATPAGAHGSQHANMDSGSNMADHGDEPCADDTEPAAPGTPPCPPGMLGAGSSCATATLPTLPEAPRLAVHVALAAFVFTDDLHGSLVSATQFRPPRA